MIASHLVTVVHLIRIAFILIMWLLIAISAVTDALIAEIINWVNMAPKTDLWKMQSLYNISVFIYLPTYT